MIIHVIDTETTGLDPEKDRIVEFAAVKCVHSTHADGSFDDFRFEPWGSSLVNPGIPISPEASAKHHLIDEDVAGAPSLEEAVANVLGAFYPDATVPICGHNCRFDRAFLPMLHDRPWLDTYRCAMHVWPDAPAYGNQVLRYWMKFDLPRDHPTHRALPDAIVTAHLLAHLLRERSVDDLLKLSTKAVLLRKVSFGMHFGKLWAEVPTSYLEWSQKQDFDPDVKFTVKSELAARRST